MADPIAIIGLIDLGLRLTLEIYRFFNEVSDAPTEVHTYLSELSHLEIVYKDVRQYCKEFQSSSLSIEDGLRLETLEIVLKSSQSDLKTMLLSAETSASKVHGDVATRIKAKLKWATKEKAQFAESSKLLERCKSTLQLVLTTSGRLNDIAIRDELQTAHGEVTGVRKQLTDLSVLVLAISAGISIRMSGTLNESVTVHDITTIDLNSLRTGLQTTQQESLTGTDQFKNFQMNQAWMAPKITPKSQPDGSKIWEVRSHGNEDQRQELNKTPSGMPEPQSASKSQEEIKNLLSKLPPGKSDDRLAPFLNRYAGVVDTIAQYSPGTTSVMWGAVKLVLLPKSSSFAASEKILELLEEIGEQASWTQRELSLYNSPEIRGLGTKCHTEMLEVVEQITKLSSKVHPMIRAYQFADDTKIEQLLQRFRRTCAALTREADFQHRVELMKMSNRLVDVQVDQKKMLEALDEQKRILSSLEDQQKMMSIVADQQKILMKLNELSQKLSTTLEE